MFNYFLGAALVAAPFFIKKAPQTAEAISQEYLFCLITFIGVLLFGLKKAHTNIKIMGAGLFILAFTTSNPFGLFPYHQLIMSITGVIFIALIYTKKHEINVKHLGDILSIVCLLESAWIIFQDIGFEPSSFLAGLSAQETVNRGAKVFGSLGNINQSGALVACTLPFLRPKFWPLPMLALYLGNSTMPVICAIIGIVALVSYQSKNYLIIIGGGIALALSAIPLILGLVPANSFFSDSHRITAWKALFNDVGFQFWGKGLGYVPEVFAGKVIPGMKFYQAHNEWVELYAIAGLLGIGVGLYLIAPVFKNKGNSALNACLISLVVNSLGNFTFHTAPLFMIFGTCYALQLAKD